MEIKSTNTQDIECAIRTILSFIGENPCREGLKETPDRIIRMWKEIFRGYDLAQVPKITVFPNGVDGLSCNSVIADSGGFYSMCEHHMMPFFGKYWFGTITGTRAIGERYHCDDPRSVRFGMSTFGNGYSARRRTLV